MAVRLTNTRDARKRLAPISFSDPDGTRTTVAPPAPAPAGDTPTLSPPQISPPALPVSPPQVAPPSGVLGVFDPSQLPDFRHGTEDGFGSGAPLDVFMPQGGFDWTSIPGSGGHGGDLNPAGRPDLSQFILPGQFSSGAGGAQIAPISPFAMPQFIGPGQQPGDLGALVAGLQGQLGGGSMLGGLFGELKGLATQGANVNLPGVPSGGQFQDILQRALGALPGAGGPAGGAQFQDILQRALGAMPGEFSVGAAPASDPRFAALAAPIQEAVLRALNAPTAFDDDLFGRATSQADRELDRVYDARTADLKAELAQRGINFSDVAGDRFSDLGAERARASEDFITALTMERARQLAAGRAQALSGALSAGGLFAGESAGRRGEAMQLAQMEQAAGMDRFQGLLSAAGLAGNQAAQQQALGMDRFRGLLSAAGLAGDQSARQFGMGLQRAGLQADLAQIPFQNLAQLGGMAEGARQANLSGMLGLTNTLLSDAAGRRGELRGERGFQEALRTQARDQALQEALLTEQIRRQRQQDYQGLMGDILGAGSPNAGLSALYGGGSLLGDASAALGGQIGQLGQGLAGLAGLAVDMFAPQPGYGALLAQMGYGGMGGGGGYSMPPIGAPGPITVAPPDLGGFNIPSDLGIQPPSF